MLTISLLGKTVVVDVALGGFAALLALLAAGGGWLAIDTARTGASALALLCAGGALGCALWAGWFAGRATA